MLFLLVSGTSSSHTRRAGTFLSRWLYDEVRDRGAVLKNTNSLFVTPRHAGCSIVSWLCCSIVPSAPVRSERSSSLDDADDDHTAPTQVSRRCSSRATETPGPGPGDGTGTGTGRGAGRGARQRNRNRDGNPDRDRDRKEDPPTEPESEPALSDSASAPLPTCPRNSKLKPPPRRSPHHIVVYDLILHHAPPSHAEGPPQRQARRMLFRIADFSRHERGDAQAPQLAAAEAVGTCSLHSFVLDGEPTDAPAGCPPISSVPSPRFHPAGRRAD